MKLTTMIFAALMAVSAHAQTAHEDLLAIQDNSFLLEEAYNQGPGVIQHIGVFERAKDGDAWAFSFTEEFPVPGLKHQLSYTLPIVHGGDDTDLGDIELNYRYQLVGDADSDLAITPRLTVVLPTGDDSSTAVEGAIALSRVFAPRVAGHTNAAVAVITDGGGTELSLGQSFIYAPSSRYQLMLEGTFTHPDEGDSQVVLSPGVRWVYNRPSGWQIVPGVGLPIGVSGDVDDATLLLYLSFEK